MIALIDLDSVLYESVYKIVSISEMREAIKKHGKQGAKSWLMEEVYNEGINRCENQLLKMQNYLNDIFFEEITSYELFITTCEKSFRKELTTTYKANRRRNNYVWLLREHYRHNGAESHNELEADDLIAKRAKEIGIGKYIIVSIDKDLKQIGGHYWSYYKVKSKDSFGELIINEFGFAEREYKQKQVEFISKKEAEKLFWMQMLTGDASDNIKGITPISKETKKLIKKEYGVNLYCRVGELNAKKILSNSKNHFITVARQYIFRGQKQDFKINYQLLKLD